MMKLGTKPIWVVESVEAKKDWTLLLTFANGEKRVYDARPLLNKTIYASLKNINFFIQAKVSGDSVAWNDEVDIAPEHLYEASVPVS